MLHLELRFKGYPQIANKMLAHFPRKTNKKIRDKKRTDIQKPIKESGGLKT